MDLKDVYYSSKPYTQEEFESIIINAYKYVCEEIKTKNKRFQACHDFEPCFICWNIELEGNEFTKWIEENSDLRVINKFNASMDVGVLGSFTEDTIKLENGIDLSKIPRCKGKCDREYFFNEECFFERRRLREKIGSIEDMELINPSSIFEFIDYKEEFIDLIIESVNLIKNHFPKAKIYLKYNWDHEYWDLTSICGNIYLKDGNNDENYSIYKYKLFPDFVKLRKSYGDFNYYIEMIDSDELDELLKN